MGEPPMTLADLREEELLARIIPLLPTAAPGVLVGPGDDTAVLACRGATIVTTDAAVRDRDWRDDWCSGADVGAKIVAQNLADVAAMGGRPTGLVVTLLADPRTTVAWVEDFARGLGEAARAAEAVVLGGDLSSAPAGLLAVSVTALGELDGRDPVLRSGARVGDRVAVAGTLGRSAAGLVLLEQGRSDVDPELVAMHRRPTCPTGCCATPPGSPRRAGCAWTSTARPSPGMPRGWLPLSAMRAPGSAFSVGEKSIRCSPASRDPSPRAGRWWVRCTKARG